LAAYTVNNLTPQITIPDHAMPEDNARDYFHNAAAAARGIKHKSHYSIPPFPPVAVTESSLQACAEDAEPALRIMREGLTRPFMAPAARKFDPRFPWYAQLRELARVNVGAADYYEVKGDSGRAMQMRLDGMEMGVMIPHGDMLIGGLVGLSCEAIAEARMEPLIPLLSADELKNAAARLDKIEAKRVPYSDVIQEEGYMQAAEFLGMLKDPRLRSNTYGALTMLVSTGDDPYAAWKVRMSHQIEGIKFNMANKQSVAASNLEWFTAMAKEARTPYRGPSRVSVPSNIITRMTAEVFKDARRRFAATEAASALLRVEVALYRYHKDQGKFPASLSDLVPAYLTSIPNDPCGGGLLHYVPQDADTDFQLYSIGPDLKDDYGVAADHFGDIGGDIVAGELRKYPPILTTGAGN
jgi:hypothetical protein